VDKHRAASLSKPLTRVALFLLPNLPEKMEASPGVIFEKNHGNTNILGIPISLPQPPKKAQI